MLVFHIAYSSKERETEETSIIPKKHIPTSLPCPHNTCTAGFRRSFTDGCAESDQDVSTFLLCVCGQTSTAEEGFMIQREEFRSLGSGIIKGGKWQERSATHLDPERLLWPQNRHSNISEMALICDTVSPSWRSPNRYLWTGTALE